MYIFAVNDSKVQTISTEIDRDLVQCIRSEIDEWNGKGELEVAISDELLSDYYEEGYRIEVVSCLPVRQTFDDMSFRYEIYKYIPHPLSVLCDTFLSDCLSLDFSQCVAQLLGWKSNDEEEMSFVNRLIGAFKFKKIAEDEFVRSDLSVDQKIGVLKKIKRAITKCPEGLVVVSRAYDDAISRKLRDMEDVLSIQYADVLRGQRFHFDQNDRYMKRRQTLKTLPKISQLNNAGYKF